MKSSRIEHWSMMRSLAFLAAVFAVMFGTLLPPAVAASAASGSPIMLCSGERIMLVHDDDGRPRPADPTAMDSLKCASCVLAGLTTLPPPPPTRPEPPPRIVAIQPAPIIAAPAPAPDSVRLRPPSTAPPLA